MQYIIIISLETLLLLSLVFIYHLIFLAMPVLSILQCLPLHIAETITCYCISTRLGNKYCAEEQELGKRILTVLYNVSHSWRILALQYFFKELIIDISTENGTGQLRFCCLPGGINIDSKGYNNYVKRVSIKVSDLSYTSDKITSKDLSTVWPENLELPSAHHLHVDLSALLFQTFDEQSDDRSERFYWISQRIQSSMPKLHEVTVSDEELMLAPDRESDRYKWRADNFLSIIFGRATTFNIRTGTIQLIGNHCFTQNNMALTSIECSFIDKNYLFACLVEKPASTLESLKYDNCCVPNMRSFVINDMGIPIVYPRLRKLDVHNYELSTFDNKLQVDESIAMFPILWYLAWNSIYIFEDDTLFRGNSDTLEYLDIEVDSDLVELLQRYKVFSAGKYSQLCHVSIHYSEPDSDRPMDTDEYIRFGMHLFTPSTRSFSLTRNYFYSMMGAGTASPYLENIKVIHLTGFKGTLPELVYIVKLFPNMTRLECSPGTPDIEPQKMQFKDIIDSLYTQYYPLSHRLGHWEAISYSINDAAAIAETALAFAILCTNFTLAFVPRKCRKGTRAVVTDFIESGLYNAHIDKMQCLLRIMG